MFSRASLKSPLTALSEVRVSLISAVTDQQCCRRQGLIKDRHEVHVIYIYTSVKSLCFLHYKHSQ